MEFHRTKAQKQSLRSPGNGALTDTALSPFLGAADRNFFDQMFGLDHKKLVEGGNSILNAENDVGQVLIDRNGDAEPFEVSVIYDLILACFKM